MGSTATPVRPCVVGLFAHPDDEAYAAAGTLARCATEGARVVVVAATRGEAGVDQRSPTPAGPDLAALRSAELAESCRAIGAQPPRFLDLPDGHVRVEEGASRLAAVLGELAPDVVITLGADGAYGHPDHLATTAMLHQVATCRILHAAFPRDHFGGVRRRLARHVPLADVGPLGIRRVDAHLVVDVSAHRDQKLAAVAAHRSQLGSDDPRSFLVPGLIDPLLEEEWFVCARGPSLPPDPPSIFAGLAMAP
ncbi:MAG TPA: PIG-L family deacetylase [Polyangiaceae bacterium]|nr:PIG-L family deacetylase [Polyangiaceae bacterium]